MQCNATQCNAMQCMYACMHVCMYVFFHFHNIMYVILDARIYTYIYMNTIILRIPTTKPWTEPHHVICWATRCNLQDEDIIPECEWLAGIYGLRRPHELGTWMAELWWDPRPWVEQARGFSSTKSNRFCVRGKVGIPRANKFMCIRLPAHVIYFGLAACSRYTQDSCYKPLYRSKEMWEYLYTEWGSLAPQAR